MREEVYALGANTIQPVPIANTVKKDTIDQKRYDV